MTTLDHVAPSDPFDVRRARCAPGVLRNFNDAGVLNAADLHVARRLGALSGEDDDDFLLAAALAVRAPRLGHVCIDLCTVASTATSDLDVPVEVGALPWPGTAGWVERLSGCAAVAVGDTGEADRPLRLVGTRLYLDRYWRQELSVAADLQRRSASAVDDIDLDVLAEGVARLFRGDDDGPDLQCLASATVVLRRFSVVAGGPGTGKTTTVARVLALLDEQAAAAGRRPPRVALVTPTGKAAARLEEAVHDEAAGLDVSDETRARLSSMGASTMHRLLGWRPGSHSRFHHDRDNRLPHDVVVVDETSMVSLSLMAKLVEAVRADARLVLVGDPDQLASVEAGAVLGDIVGPAVAGMRMTEAARSRLATVTGQQVPATSPSGATTLGDGIVVLRRAHRYGGAIAKLAEAVQRGDADGALDVLAAGHDDVRWIDVDVAVAAVDMAAALGPVRAALGSSRVLCAHRRGPYGVATWMAHVESWLARGIDGYGVGGRWYVGRPLLVTANDHGLRLYNGDTGVVVDDGDGRPRVVFERRGELVEMSLSRLEAVETVHAMTIHKAQGSQFDAVIVLLPDETSPILTRELLYTAVTRAQARVTVVGPASAIRAAVGRPIARASGLADRLWAECSNPEVPAM